METLVIIALVALFLLGCAAKWASKSIPRAIVFVALLCASPVIFMFFMGLLIATNDSQKNASRTVGAPMELRPPGGYGVGKAKRIGE